ncbi:MAG: hypothetical protein IKO80_09860 [Lachnospiraceae bacterium]|nr:hypothetical protein [Lachnospiraceae bacterium]
MTGYVNIKGTDKGVILVLDAEASFEELRDELAERIGTSAHFFRDARFPVRIRGRNLSEEEQEELLAIIRRNAHVTVTDLVVEPPLEPRHLTADEIFDTEDAIDEEEDDEQGRTFGDTEELSPADREILKELERQLSGDFAIIHTGPVKSGETIRSEYSLVILGDVREGGRVEANGSVYVLGSLFGEVSAGYEGNSSAIVMSANLKPQSLSIGAMEGYRGSSRSKRQPFGKKRLVEVACIKGGEVVRMSYPEFIKENRII